MANFIKNFGYEFFDYKTMIEMFDHNKKKIESKFPELIFKMILESGVIVNQIPYIPTNDETNFHGFDGVIDVKEGNELIPNGFSVLEMGTNKDIRRKFNDDYHKRTENKSKNDLEDKIFIFVTYLNLDLDLSNYKNDGWKDVRIINGYKIWECLRFLPKTSLWILEEFGDYNKLNLNIQTLNQKWEEISNLTTPNLNEEFFLCKRDEEIKLFNKNLRKTNELTLISANSTLEAIGFVLSVIKNTKNKDLIENTFLINDKETFASFDKAFEDKILLLNFQCEDRIMKSKNKLIKFIFDFNNSEGIIKLNDRGEEYNFILEKTLNLRIEDISSISRKCGTNFDLLINEIGNYKNHEISFYKNIEKIIPLLVVGKYNISNSTDRDIIEKLLLKDRCYAEFWEKVQTLFNKTNTPIIYNSPFIGVNCKKQLWNIYNNDLDLYFENFKKLATLLFVNKTSFNGSNEVLQGMLESLILYSLDENKINDIYYLVECILSNIENYSYENYKFLNLIVEASPIPFFNLFNDNKFLMSYESPLFCKKEMSGEQYQVDGILRSLEQLLYIENYRADAMKILSKIYHDKRLNNAADYGITQIMIRQLFPLSYVSSLDVNKRKKYIKKFISNNNYKILDVILPSKRRINFIPCPGKPTIKYWGYEQPINNSELCTFINEIIEFALEKDFVDEKSLKCIIYNVDLINDSLFDLLLDKLNKINSTNIELAYELYDYTLEVMHKKADFFGELCENYLNKIIDVLKPEDDFEQIKPYFDVFDDNKIPFIISNKNIKNKFKKVKEFREKIIKDLILKYSFEKVISELIKFIDPIFKVGEFLIQFVKEDKLELFFNLAIEANKPLILIPFIQEYSEFAIHYLSNLDENTFINNLGLLNGFDSNLLNDTIFRKEEIKEKFFKTEFKVNSCSEYCLNALKKYNIKKYMESLLNFGNFSSVDPNKLIKWLQRNKNKIQKDEEMSIYIKDIFLELDSILFKLTDDNYRELAMLELELFNVFDYDNVPNLVKKAILKCPEVIIKMLTNNRKNYFYELGWYLTDLYKIETNGLDVDAINFFSKLTFSDEDVSPYDLSIICANVFARTFNILDENTMVFKCIENTNDDYFNYRYACELNNKLSIYNHSNQSRKDLIQKIECLKEKSDIENPNIYSICKYMLKDIKSFQDKVK